MFKKTPRLQSVGSFFTTYIRRTRGRYKCLDAAPDGARLEPVVEDVPFHRNWGVLLRTLKGKN